MMVVSGPLQYIVELNIDTVEQYCSSSLSVSYFYYITLLTVLLLSKLYYYQDDEEGTGEEGTGDEDLISDPEGGARRYGGMDDHVMMGEDSNSMDVERMLQQ